MNTDPWQQVTTVNGLPADEVISALQKTIRRSLTEQAVALAWEMYCTSEALEDFAWQRLLVISVEDVGFGAVEAPVLVSTLERIRRRFDFSAPDRPLFLVHAVRYLSAQPKDRSSDLLRNITEEEFRRGRIPEIPDFALDMHTRRGQELGRGMQHFLTEASRVEPLSPGSHDVYLARLSDLLAAEPEGPSPE